MKNIALFILLFVCIQTIQAQDQQASIRAFFGKMNEVYRSKQPLSFQVHYKYALVDQPGLVLDSVEGEYKMLNSAYWSKLAGIESVRTGDYQIAIYPEDKYIMVSKPKASPMDFMQAIDSLLSHPEMASLEIPRDGRLLIKYHGPVAAPECVIDFDPASYLITHMRYTVDPRMLGADAEQPGQSTAVIDVYLDHYTRDAIDKALFDKDRYFKKKGKELIPAGQYSDFQILNGSTQTLN